MDQQKLEIIEKLQSSNNILVTVSSNPSVDQLAACIGLTLLLNKLDKHATAVFSGQIPSTIEFLKPEETIEKNTDSLRDFIIALDKTKADKLRYKVEDRVVKIFITPYRTSLSADDLNFSQGDFNIDIVVALGVHQQADLDQAITAHGRILHDATVACINNTPNGELGTVNWSKQDASSLSELVVEIAKSFERPLLDEQIATALLTGIVAETDRFRNEKTTAATMTLSADLMNAGANQKLVAEELEHQEESAPLTTQSQKSLPAEAAAADGEAKSAEATKPKRDDGTLEISHDKRAAAAEASQFDESDEATQTAEPQTPTQSEESKHEPAATAPAEPAPTEPSRSLITEAPTLGGSLTANTLPEEARYDPSIDPLAGGKGNQPLLNHDDQAEPAKTPEPTPPAFPKAADNAPDMFRATSAPAPTPPRPVELPPVPPTASPLSSTPFMPPTPRPTPPPAAQPSPPPRPAPETPPVNPEQPRPDTGKHETLTELEETVESPHLDDGMDPVEKARQEVLRAINEQPTANLEPVQALNAQPVDLGKHDDLAEKPQQPGAGPLPPFAPSAPTPPIAPLPPNAPDRAPFSASPADQPLTMPMPPGISLPPPQVTPPTNAPVNPNSPPPVPPPMMPPNFGQNQQR